MPSQQPKPSGLAPQTSHATSPTTTPPPAMSYLSAFTQHTPLSRFLVYINLPLSSISLLLAALESPLLPFPISRMPPLAVFLWWLTSITVGLFGATYWDLWWDAYATCADEEVRRRRAWGRDEEERVLRVRRERIRERWGL